MSRVAKVPVHIPQDVQVKIENNEITIKGKLGELKQKVNGDLIDVKHEDGKIVFDVKDGSKFANALSGTMRALVANMVKGVTEGFEKKLTILGVGYKAAVQGQKLNLNLGYSHPIDYPLPEGVKAEVGQNNEITLKGSDKQVLGQVAAEIRSLRAPEPYKGKGVRYSDEYVAIKETKKKK